MTMSIECRDEWAGCDSELKSPRWEKLAIWRLWGETVEHAIGGRRLFTQLK